MAKIDYEHKSRVLKTGLCKRINYIDKRTYLNDINGIIKDNDLDNQYFNLLLEYDYKDICEARKINKATYQRLKRLKERIKDMLQYDCVFITLNFSDKTLKETNEGTRRKIITRYLKSFNCPYVANKDYGSDKEYKDRKGNIRKGTKREHYHALVQIDYMSKKEWSKYGQLWREKVKVCTSSEIRLSKYISKLTNHAIKESTKRSALIYSRENKAK